jgi:hypothetical protein
LSVSQSHILIVHGVSGVAVLVMVRVCGWFEGCALLLGLQDAVQNRMWAMQ